MGPAQIAHFALQLGDPGTLRCGHPIAAASVDLGGHVATITNNRPEAMNAINGDMRKFLNAAWMELYNNPDAWVAIMTGEGRAFCAGT